MDELKVLIGQLQDQNAWEKKITLSRNEFLKVKGSTDVNLYYLIKGSLRIFVEDGLEEQTIRFGYQGNLIAALDSYLTGKPSDLYIQALKKTELKVISKSAFEKVIYASLESTQLWLKTIHQLVHGQMERERDLLTVSPVDRYNRVLKRSPQLFQEIPHKYIASYLRMTPETLSRLKKS